MSNSPKNERQAHVVIFHGATRPVGRHIAPAPVRKRAGFMAQLVLWLKRR